MRILIDLDETVLRMLPKWVFYYNKRHGTDLKVEDITTWEMPGEWRFWETILMEPGFFRDLPIEPDALDTIMRFEDEGHECHILTAAVSGEAAKDKYMWCHTTFVVPGVLPGMDRVHISRNKKLFRGDILIDDRPKYVDEFQGKVIVFDRPWNQHVEGSRAYDWGEVDALVFAIEVARRKGRSYHLGGCV